MKLSLKAQLQTDSFLKAHMVLLTKVPSPEAISDLRPITLLNISYKIISKVLVARLRHILQRVLGPYHNTFLAGRSTANNILLVQEMVHSLMNLKGKRGSMILKLDIHKAYDRVRWSFLHETLPVFDFPPLLMVSDVYSLSY